VSKEPANEPKWLTLPLWTPQVNHRNSKIVECLTNPKTILREAGYKQVAHVITADGSYRQWHAGLAEQAPRGCKKEYEKMLGNLKPMPTFVPGCRTQKLVYCEDSASLKVWEYKVLTNITDEDAPSGSQGEATNWLLPPEP
jgi:hypothetical protein